MLRQFHLHENTRTDAPLLEGQLPDATGPSSCQRPLSSCCSLSPSPPPPPPTRQTQSQSAKRSWKNICRIPPLTNLTNHGPEDTIKSKERSGPLPLLFLNNDDYNFVHNNNSGPPFPIPKNELGTDENENDDDNTSQFHSLSQDGASTQRLLIQKVKIEVGSCYVPLVHNSVWVTCETCWRQFLLTPKDPCRLERHQQKFCRTRTQRRVQRWWSEIEAFADRIQNRVALTQHRLLVDEEENGKEENEAKGCLRREDRPRQRWRRGLFCGYYAGKKISKMNMEKMKREAEALEKKEWRSAEVDDQGE